MNIKDLNPVVNVGTAKNPLMALKWYELLDLPQKSEVRECHHEDEQSHKEV